MLILSCREAEHRRTLEAIYSRPTPANIAWREIEALFETLGADISEGSGSRVIAALKGVRAVFHRPHNRKEAGRGLM
jgi:HicA toxin of bacterial toxin-antitoxin,